jgi:adenylate cyclase
MIGRGKSQLRFPLTAKLSFLIISLLLVTMVLVSTFLLRQEQKSLIEEMSKRGLTSARHVASSAKNSLATRDELSLNLLVRDAMMDSDLRYIAIVDRDGTILAHDDVKLIDTKLERPKELAPLRDTVLIQSYRTSNQEQIVDISVPLVFSQVPLGSLYMGFSQKNIVQTLLKARNDTLWISGGMILIGISGAIWLSVVLSRPIHRLVEGTKAIAAQNFDVALPVPSRDELGDLTESFNEMARSLREKEQIKEAFSKYVSRDVVQEILKNPNQITLTGDRREVTVIFCDMRGFTPLAEKLPPEEAVAILNEFYGLMIDATFKNEGTLDKFLGDAVMSVFGAPIRQEDHCIRALKTALEMRSGIIELSANRSQQGAPPIAIGIGVSTGEVVAGTVGAQDRMEYTVIGDRVNLAARLVSNAQPGQILISQWTYDKISHLIEARPLGVTKVKGKEEEIQIYEVLGFAS